METHNHVQTVRDERRRYALSAQQELEVCRLLDQKVRQETIAERFGVHRNTIGAIARRRKS